MTTGNPPYKLHKFNVLPISNGFLVEFESIMHPGKNYRDGLLYGKEFRADLEGVAALFSVLFLTGDERK